jgi:CheY-like chemotaxis protein
MVAALAKLAWPVLAAIALAFLLPALKEVVQSRQFKLKIGEFELSVEQATEGLIRQIQDLQNQVRDIKASAPFSPTGTVAVAAPTMTASPTVTVAAITRPTGRAGMPTPLAARTPTAVAISSPAATFTAQREGVRVPHPSTILWVDDHPANNAYEIAKLSGDGYEISTAESTASALALVQSRAIEPGLVITDMSRTEGLMPRATAGLDLIRALRSRGFSAPIVVYTTGEEARRNADDVRTAGGNGITSSPVELLALVDTLAPICKSVVHIKSLGWREGNKTEFCRTSGYDGNFNPFEKYRDGGYCYRGDLNACMKQVEP